MAESKPRFKSVDASDLRAFVDGSSSDATKKATSYWLKVVTAYREEQNDRIAFGTCTPQECNDFLCRFYAAMKPQKEGEAYRKNSYLAARGALQRHLRVVGRPFNIFTDEEFRRSNEVLNGILATRKKKGVEPNVQHKLPISEEDMTKLKAYFSDVLEADNPIKLTQYVWFVLTIHFCLRGQEVQHQLKKDDLVFLVERSSPTSAPQPSNSGKEEPQCPEPASGNASKEQPSIALPQLLVAGQQASFKHINISVVQHLYTKRAPDSSAPEPLFKISKKE